MYGKYIMSGKKGSHCYLHKLHGGSTSHNRIIHQQHILVFKLTLDRVQLQSHRFSSHFLTRHDEGASNVTILNEPFAIRTIESMGALEGLELRVGLIM